ncbi:MAG TPA: ClbS/DfsB family four-helix bundle protein, partial [Thermomicrobiales bacterium]|nr:ClbS/DfsB family four-helix bundle protein [Thermomicrobiales bacterium]
DAGVERINAWIYEQSRDRPLQDVLGESRAQFRQLGDIVAALPEEELTDPRRFPWTGGMSLAQAVLGGALFGHLHEEHEPAIRAWLAAENQLG